MLNCVKIEEVSIGVIGLGYVGLPLAVELSKFFSVTGYDVDETRIAELKNCIDRTREVSESTLKEASSLSFSSSPDDIRECDLYIITVPTPINHDKTPDLSALESASELVGGLLQPGNTVVYESTVYPGATEEVCAPILQKHSGLLLNTDFFLGYSPERINPGDKSRRLQDIVKIISGSTAEAADAVAQVYGKIIDAGVYRAESIMVAEAAKVIENTQRDLNIALINELSIIFNKLELDTSAVLEAAATKWNFISFQPGLVGGHCIGVDPYYLTHKAEAVGYVPEVILSGRRLNDRMSNYVADQAEILLAQANINIVGANVLIFGLSFKPNCPDLRNSKVSDVIKHLIRKGALVDVHDPLADPSEAEILIGSSLISAPKSTHYHLIVIAVDHDVYKQMSVEDVRGYGVADHVFMDLKGVFSKAESDFRL